MIKPFSLSRIPETCFGSGSVARLADILSKTGCKNIFVITGRSSFKNSPYYNTVINILDALKTDYSEATADYEPTPGVVDELTRKARDSHASLVLAIGGGSAIDTGKAVSAMVPVIGSVVDYLEGIGTKTHPGSKIPMIAVPTTAGTGSEATKNAVIAEVGEKGFKKSLRHENFIPDYAVIDPMLAASCPRNVTAACGMDAMNQLLEACLSVRSNPYTQAIALSGIENIMGSLEALYFGDPKPELREKMAYGAYVSGIALANAGLGIVHGFASSIGGLIDIPHGIVCGKLQATTMKIVFEEIYRNRGDDTSSMAKLRGICDAAGIDASCNDWDRVDGLTERLFELEKALGMPHLSKYGLTEETAVKAAKATSCKESPVKLDERQLLKLILNNI